MNWKIDRTGCTRIVILTRRYAIKMPNFIDDYRLFLTGLLANLQESRFGKTGWPQLCPVLFSLPFGLLVVMPKLPLLTDGEFEAFDVNAFRDQQEYYVPVEPKSNSFGWFNDRIVAIDYGS
jgi:hypothetical protein